MDKLLKLTPVVSVLTLISGILNLSVYYFQFQIRITDFLEWTEIFILFINDLVEFLIILLVGVIMFVSEDISGKIRKGDRNFPESILALSKLPRFLSFFLLIPVLLILSSLGGYGSTFWIYVTILTILIELSLRFSDFVQYRSGGYIEKTSYYIIVLFILLNVYKIPLNLYKGSEKKFDVTTRNVSLDIDGRHISPYSKEYYIGKTNQYVFTYNQSKGQTIVYPIGKLNELKYHSLYEAREPEDYSFKLIWNQMWRDFANSM